jgi:hypothetical protein
MKTRGLKKPDEDVDFFIDGASGVDHSVAAFVSRATAGQGLPSSVAELLRRTGRRPGKPGASAVAGEKPADEVLGFVLGCLQTDFGTKGAVFSRSGDTCQDVSSFPLTTNEH